MSDVLRKPLGGGVDWATCAAGLAARTTCAANKPIADNQYLETMVTSPYPAFSEGSDDPVQEL